MMFGRNFELFACSACDADDTKQIFDRNRFDWKCSFVHFSLILLPENDFKYEWVVTRDKLFSSLLSSA